MKKYNRGVTIVEILLSILIIGLVVLILFNLLIVVRNEDQNNQIQSQYLLNQARYVEIIEEDIINYGVNKISACDLYSVDMDSYNINDAYRDNFKCIRFDFASDYLRDNIGYLMIYNYNFRYDVENRELLGRENTWMIRYIRGHYDDAGKWITLNSNMNEIPDDADLSVTPTVKFNRTNVASYYDGVSVNIPIISAAGEHYDVNLSFLVNSTTPFVCYNGSTSSAAYAKINCDCQGALCAGSINSGIYNPEASIRAR